MRSQPLSLHLVRSAYTFIDADCLLSIVLHPYYKLAYIELAWGGAKEQEAEFEAGNFVAKNWQDEAWKILEKTVSNTGALPRVDHAPPTNVLLMLQVERYWKTRPKTTSMTHNLSPVATVEQTDDSIISDFDRHHLTLVYHVQDEGWEAEIRRYLKDLPASVSKDTDIVEWWQVCFTATSISLFAHCDWF